MRTDAGCSHLYLRGGNILSPLLYSVAVFLHAVPIHPTALHFSIPSSANRWPKQVARLLLPLLHALTTAAATPAPLGQQRARAVPCLRNLHNRFYGPPCSNPFVCLYACMHVCMSVHVCVPARSIVDYSPLVFSLV